MDRHRLPADINVSVPIFASLSDIHGRKPFFLLGATLFVATSASVELRERSPSCRSTAWVS